MLYVKKNIVTAINLLTHVSEFILSKRVTEYVIEESYTHIYI